MNKEYLNYLNSKEWSEMKLDLIQSRGCKCEQCNRGKLPNKLQLHHKTYERIFNELPSDLILLCARCHMKQHIDIIPKKVLVKVGLRKPKKKVFNKKIKKPKQFKPKKKKKLTAYQKAIIHFRKK